MHRRTLEELAYFRIINSVSLYCVSQEARELFEKAQPLTDADKIEEIKNLSREWTSILQDVNGRGIESWLPVGSFLRILKIEGSTLEKDQAYSLMQFCASALSAVRLLSAVSERIRADNLLELSKTIDSEGLSGAYTEIERVLDRDGNLKELPAIREIKGKIASIKAEIDASLKKYTSDSSLSGVLASNVPAFRADRQVLAVKANQRLRITGIVHEVSSSGQTMFIEPDEVVRKNNELIQEEFHLQQETRKIFTELTARLSGFYESLKNSLPAMLRLDRTCAAAKWGIENKCTFALPCPEDDSPCLISARHPLLAERAVPIDMRFLPGKRILIITGPNTGGKTVSIKTFALLSLLNQTGLPVPAADGTKLAVFANIFADIGDEQSIDQSLSTFSAHMKNIAAAVRHAGKDSLVLLDELGSGTDPQEGGAVAMAVLDSLIERKSFVLVTTHHGILKNYGYTNPACINASVDFDPDTLSPTYRLLMGVPGESHALDIAKKSGLPGAVVDKARSYIANEQADVSSLIKGLTEKYAELDELEQSARERQRKIQEKELRQAQRNLDLQEMEIQLRERESRNESIFVSQTRKQLENLVRILREGEITREKNLRVKQFIAELTESTETQERAVAEAKERLEKEAAALKEKEKAVIAENGIRITTDEGNRSASRKSKSKRRLSAKEAFAAARNTYTDEEIQRLSGSISPRQEYTPPEFAEGAEVIHLATKTRGTLIKKEKKGVWTVQLGSIRMSLSERSMMPVETSAKTVSFSVELSKDEDSFTKPQYELRLLGMREEEALKVLQKQLDLCRMNSFKNFSIIHGKGNGILQQAVRDYLSQYPGVKDFRFAPPEDGGTGKTYVTLD